MAQEGSKYRDDEATRPCPVCRMPVSNLAVKCRFCGAELGRPREETRKLSIEELGGETVKHYAPSANVMDALESFRTEEIVNPKGRQTSKADAKRRGRGKKGEAEETASTESEMPELDARSRALASAGRATPPPASAAKKKRSLDWGAYGRYAAIAATALVVLYLAVTVGPRLMQARQVEPVVENRAVAMLEGEEEPLTILSAAMEAVRAQNTDDNQYILDRAREEVTDQIEGLLNAENWEMGKLKEASDLARRAADIDPHRSMQDLKKEVDREFRLYQTKLMSAEGGVATLQVVEPSLLALGDERGMIEVKRGEIIADRFRVTNVSSKGITLVDVGRDDRILEAHGLAASLQAKN